jgi:hypothetical protein
MFSFKFDYTHLFLQDVINYNCRSLVAAVPFFTNAEPEFVSSVVTKLNYEVFQPGKQLFRKKDVKPQEQAFIFYSTFHVIDGLIR